MEPPVIIHIRFSSNDRILRINELNTTNLSETSPVLVFTGISKTKIEFELMSKFNVKKSCKNKKLSDFHKENYKPHEEEKEHWELICKRFQKFEENPHIKCMSIPIISPKKRKLNLN